MLNLYITSSQKRQGKTFLTAGISATMQSLGYSTSVYKPIQTSGKELNGFVQSPDLTFIKTIDPYINTHFSYLYKSDLEPVIAAEADSETIDIDYINNEYKRITSVSDCTIIDGDSGILSPIAPNILVADMLRKLNVPLLIVTEPDLNAVNNTFMTIACALEKGIEIRGVVINNIKKDCPKNLLNSFTRIIEEYTNVKILGLIPHLSAGLTPEDLITAILNGVDIESIFNVKIEKLDMN
jgi:dethiobiotin synthetase